jgi:hypothetical protein
LRGSRKTEQHNCGECETRFGPVALPGPGDKPEYIAPHRRYQCFLPSLRL